MKCMPIRPALRTLRCGLYKMDLLAIITDRVNLIAQKHTRP